MLDTIGKDVFLGVERLGLWDGAFVRKVIKLKPDSCEHTNIGFRVVQPGASTAAILGYNMNGNVSKGKCGMPIV